MAIGNKLFAAVVFTGCRSYFQWVRQSLSVGAAASKNGCGSHIIWVGSEKTGLPTHLPTAAYPLEDF